MENQDKATIIPVEQPENETDLRFLMRLQQELMDMLGMPESLPVQDILTSPLFKDVLIMLAGEAAEALEPLTITTKPWKWDDANVLREEAKTELIDIFFFWMEALIVAGISAEEASRRYQTKRTAIIRRRLGKVDV